MLQRSLMVPSLLLAVVPLSLSACKTNGGDSETKDADVYSYQAAINATADDCKDIRTGIAKGVDWDSPSGLVSVKVMEKDDQGKEYVDKETGYPVALTVVTVKPSPNGEYVCSAPIVLDKPNVSLIGLAPKGDDGMPGRVKIKLAAKARAPMIVMGKMNSPDKNDRIPTTRMLEVDNFELDGNRYAQIDEIQLRVIENEFLSNRKLREVWAYGVQQANNDQKARPNYKFEIPGSLDALTQKVQASLDAGGTDVNTYRDIELDLFKVLRTLRRAAENKGTNTEEADRIATVRVFEDLVRQSLQDYECWMRDCGKMSQETHFDQQTNTPYLASIIRNNGITLRGALFSTVKNVKAMRQLSGGMVPEKHCVALTVEDFESYENFFDGFAGYQTGDETPKTVPRANKEKTPKMPPDEMQCDPKKVSTFTRLNLHDNLHAGISIDINFSCNKFIDTDIINNGHVGVFARCSYKNVYQNVCIFGNHEHGIFLAMANPNPPEPAAFYEFHDIIVEGNDGYGMMIPDLSCKGTLMTGGQLANNLQMTPAVWEPSAIGKPGLHIEMQGVADGQNTSAFPLKTVKSCLKGTGAKP